MKLGRIQLNHVEGVVSSSVRGPRGENSWCSCDCAICAASTLHLSVRHKQQFCYVTSSEKPCNSYSPSAGAMFILYSAKICPNEDFFQRCITTQHFRTVLNAAGVTYMLEFLMAGMILLMVGNLRYGTARRCRSVIFGVLCELSVGSKVIKERCSRIHGDNDGVKR
jgi:hypothetical protein